METDLYNPVPGSVLCLADPGCVLDISQDVLSHFPLQSSSFMLPEVEFWCSPAELELEVGERPEESVSVSPVMRETNTTDHCLMFTEGANTTQCSRWDFSRTVSPESVVSEFSLVCSNEWLRSGQSPPLQTSEITTTTRIKDFLYIP